MLKDKREIVHPCIKTCFIWIRNLSLILKAPVFENFSTRKEWEHYGSYLMTQMRLNILKLNYTEIFFSKQEIRKSNQTFFHRIFCNWSWVVVSVILHAIFYIIYIIYTFFGHCLYQFTIFPCTNFHLKVI